MRVGKLKRMRYRMYAISWWWEKLTYMWGKWKEIGLKSLQRKLFLRFAPFKLNMKLLYTIKIFEFTLTRNGHFGFICLKTEMVSVDYLHVYMSIFKYKCRLGEAGEDPTNIKRLMLREKGKGLIGKGGGVRQNCVNSSLNSFRKGTVEYKKY